MTRSDPRVHIVVPARYASTRLPAKPLVDIAGKPMIVRVAERIAPLVTQGRASSMTIATDHQEIFEAVTSAGFKACMTDIAHPTGTDRLAQAAALLKLDEQDIVVNVQGDEPLIDPAIVMAVADKLVQSPGASISTAAHPIHDCETFFNPNVVKVVVDERGLARYFSRAPIPYARDAFATSKALWPSDLVARRHIGLYAYRVSYLQRYAQLHQPLVEKLESLEQLRALLNGYEIAVLDWPHALAAGVDTQEDLDRVRREFSR
jgi:3-deoxy-manno-octulosonate cytidylyltransferase (CMP-KDO synthetase)